MKAELNRRLREVRLLALDVDGTLTDGGVYMFEDGREFRRFNIKDGLGLKELMAAGVKVAWISSGGCQAIVHRARQLGIDQVYTGIKDKAPFFEQLCLRNGIPLEKAAYMGDDLADLDVMRRSGVTFAPADAVEGIRSVADCITHLPGGYGAVREVCDLIIWSKKEHA